MDRQIDDGEGARSGLIFKNWAGSNPRWFGDK
jgi:hypothetical protein